MSKKDLKEVLERAAGSCIGLGIVVLLYFFLLRFSSFRALFGKWIHILMPFVYGGTMAYLLKTPCNFFENLYEAYLPRALKKKKTGLAVLTVLVLAFVIIYVLLSNIVPQVIVSIATLSKTIPKFTRSTFDWTSNYLNSDGMVQNYIRPIVENLSEETVKWANEGLLPQLQGMVGNVTETLSSIAKVAGNLGIGFIVCVYALASRKKFARQGRAVLYSLFSPAHADMLMTEIRFIDATFDGFISGKVLDSAIVGVICYAFCLIMTFTRGFSNGVLISLIIGITNIIPYFGPFIGAIPSVLLIAMSDPVNAVIFLIFVVLLQQFDGNVLGPRLLAGSVGLSGFWVLFSITLFSGLFGFVGVLIGVPVFAVIYDLLKKNVIRGLMKHDKLELLLPGENEPTKKSADHRKKEGFLEEVIQKKIAENKEKEQAEKSDKGEKT